MTPGQREEPAPQLVLIKSALINAPQFCPYHGSDFEKAGTSYGEPRCDSCKQPWHVVRALAALRALAGEKP